MGDSNDRNETSEALESGLEQAGNIAERGIESAANHHRQRENESGDGNGNSNKTPKNENRANENSPEKSSSSPRERDYNSNNLKSAPSDKNGGAASQGMGAGDVSNGISNGAESLATSAGAESAGSVAGGTAGTAAGAGTGASAGATAGATAGSAAGPVGTIAGAAVGTFVSKFLKYIVFLIIVGLFLIGGIVEELVPNIITKPVSTARCIAEGIYQSVKNIFHNLVDFFTGSSETEERTIETLEEATQYCVDIIDEMMEASYESAADDIKKLCEEKGYDYQATMDSFSAQGGIYSSTNYAYIISAYSITTDFTNVTVKDFKEKFRSKLKITYSISDEAKQKTVYDSVPIYKYKSKSVTICEDEYEEEDEEDDSTHTVHETTEYTIYEKTDEVDTREDGTGYWISNIEGEYVKNYVDATLIPRYDDSCHDNGELDGMYAYGPDISSSYSDKILIKPVERIVTYAEITMIPYENDDVYEMFEIDPDAMYQDGYETTNRQMIEMRMKMMEGLVNNILTTAHVNYATTGLTKEQIEDYMNSLPDDLSGNRKQVIKTALSLVGMVPYYYGGKPRNTGWNDNWWSDVTPDHKGRRKDGLDCSGFVQWVFATAGFNGGNLDSKLLSTGSISQLQYITADELQPGDIGLKYQGDSKHTGIYMGNGTWIHCSSSGTVVVAPGYSGFPTYKRYRPSDMEGDSYYTSDIPSYGVTPSYNYTGDKWYFIAQCVYQECSTNVEGTIAVAECIKNRCLSTDFPNDPVAVLTQKSQFEAYGSGAYKRRAPTADQIELVKEGIGGTKCVLYNKNVLFFVSNSYHRTHWNSSNWLYKAGYHVFGEYGDNTYYVK